MDALKLPRWARDMLAEKDRQIRALQSHRDALLGTVTVPNQIGTVRLRGYHDQPLPLDRYFQLEIETGPASGLNIGFVQDRLVARCIDAHVITVPVVSNVLELRRLGW